MDSCLALMTDFAASMSRLNELPELGPAQSYSCCVVCSTPQSAPLLASPDTAALHANLQLCPPAVLFGTVSSRMLLNAPGCKRVLRGVSSVVCSYALGDLLEMAGYGLSQRGASSVQISGLCSDPYKVCRVCRKLP